VPATDVCAPRANAEADVVKQVVEMYAALRVDDLARFRAAVAPGFYAFDGGERYDGDALATLISTAHAAGKRFVKTADSLDDLAAHRSLHVYDDIVTVSLFTSVPLK
jgi:hypothetical protein